VTAKWCRPLGFVDDADVAQLVEHLHGKAEVPGSSPGVGFVTLVLRCLSRVIAGGVVVRIPDCRECGTSLQMLVGCADMARATYVELS
jgi:hypothetical protein